MLWRQRPFFLTLALISAASFAHAGPSFDTGVSPEEARDLLASTGQPTAPADSWLRIRGMETSFVRDSAAEIPLWPAARPAHSLAERRTALGQLQAHGFHLVALLRWNPESWPHGIRSEHPLRRLPLDLRDAFDRCRALAASYGDLIDYWEIENEPDIGFVEENPETYAAFLKACYLGIAAGRPEDGRRRTEDGNQMAEDGGRENRKTGAKEDRPSEHPTIGSSGLPVLRSAGPPSISTRSRVLMAPLALPPGPYFNAFLANGGLRYTDGFNYHYYGYAEDFTGVYEQFRDAIRSFEQPEDRMVGRSDSPKPSAQASDPPPIRSSDLSPFRLSGLPSDTAVLTTRFYPNTSGWPAVPVFDFDFPAAEAAAHRAQLQARPLAEGEPKLTPQGRWLVSSGVTVEETAGSWQIRVDRLPTEPMRPAMAELPLPDDWQPGLNALLSFAYRIMPSEDQRAGRQAGQQPGKPAEPPPAAPTTDHPLIRSSALPALPSSGRPSPIALRPLPVFLTEYGYGLLSKEARDASEGRTRQATWFHRVQSQIHTLGITRAMAFVLKPYLENDRQEFGLLVQSEDGNPTPEAGRQEGGRADARKSDVLPTDLPTIGSSGIPALWPSGLPIFRASPALSTLITDSATSLPAQDWTISEPLAQTPVVIDFVAGARLNQSKSYTGYLARGDFGHPEQPASAQLVLYNFGSASITGDLQLTGESWAFADASRTATLTLAPGERRELPVLITPAPLFAPQPATAIFRPSDLPGVRPSGPPSSATHPPAPVTSPLTPTRPEARAIATAVPGQLVFDVYLRTANGNLFSVGSQLAATNASQRQTQRLGNLSMAFFGRAQFPWLFAADHAAALVFFLRPDVAQLPATLEIAGAGARELVSP